jgi:SAM-dependent methyltransferase
MVILVPEDSLINELYFCYYSTERKICNPLPLNPRKESQMLTVPEIDNLARGFMAARVILTGVELDLFGILDEGSLTAPELAQKLKTDRRATELLADALVGVDLLQKENGRYQNTPPALKYLSSQSPRYRGGGLRHLANLWNSWDRLTEVVRSGGPAGLPRTEASRTAFVQAMEHLAKGVAERLALNVDLSGITRLLDLGGGPGSYAIALAKKYPWLQAVVFDLPYALEIARQAIDEAGLADRVATQPGDFNTDGLGKDFGAVLLSAIIHSLDETENLPLLERIREALSPGGLLIIRDFLVDDSHTQPPQAALFAVNMLVNTPGGKTYSFNEVAQWLTQLGFKEIRQEDLDGRSQLILARKG